MTDYSFSPDDDRIVSHDASRLGLYYHYVRDVIIYFTLSGWNHGVLSHLFVSRGFCFQEYRFSLHVYPLRIQGEFCCCSEGFYLCFIGLSRSTNKRKAYANEEELSSLQLLWIRLLTKLFAGVRSPVLIQISSSCDITENSQDSVLFSGLLTEKSDLRSCFCVLTMRHRGGVRFVLKQ